jgi:hypothetical protein
MSFDSPVRITSNRDLRKFASHSSGNVFMCSMQLFLASSSFNLPSAISAYISPKSSSHILRTSPTLRSTWPASPRTRLWCPRASCDSARRI